MKRRRTKARANADAPPLIEFGGHTDYLRAEGVTSDRRVVSADSVGRFESEGNRSVSTPEGGTHIGRLHANRPNPYPERIRGKSMALIPELPYRKDDAAK